MFDSIAWLGFKVFEKLATFFRAWRFLFKILSGGHPARNTFRVFEKQLWRIGLRSLLIMVCSSIFVGVVLALQAFRLLRGFGSGGTCRLGEMVALSMIRELGPVLAALLFVGSIGTAITSEVGLMKATEQLATLEIMAVDPVRRVFVPRFWAIVLILPLLTLLFIATGVLAGAFGALQMIPMDRANFWTKSGFSLLLGKDTLHCLAKSVAFSGLIAWVTLFVGHDATPTPQGVSEAATQGVVVASFCTLAINFLITFLSIRG